LRINLHINKQYLNGSADTGFSHDPPDTFGLTAQQLGDVQRFNYCRYKL